MHTVALLCSLGMMSDMAKRDRHWLNWVKDWGRGFSYIGLVVGAFCFAASLTPSLLPRHFVVQGALSGVAFTIGYGIGKLIVLVWQLFEVPLPSERIVRGFKWTMAIVALIICASFLSQTTRWQNSIRLLMGMEPEVSAYPFSVAMIALLTAGIVITIARIIQGIWRVINSRLKQYIPPRVSFVISTTMTIVLLLLLLNNVLTKVLLHAADNVFLQLDSVNDGKDPKPTDPFASGSVESLIEWDTIGQRGKDFVMAGPTQNDITLFLNRSAAEPIRVYAGYRSMEDVVDRAKLALAELKRVGGFERKVLIVAIPTGTGWLDQNAVDPVEYMHAGDTAIVSMGYSYLPSWMTLLIDPDRSRAAARALFLEVYGHWQTLPRDERPRLYLYGLSLGSLGAESTIDLYTMIGDPIDGGVFSGPPFPSTMWNQIVTDRVPGSPIWLPKFRDGSIVRFTGKRNTIYESGNRWGPMRFVYIQHPSDPMVFFSPDLLWKEPAWLQGQRGPDVSPFLRWFPIVTCLQISFDLPMATSVPLGHGHNYDAGSYIDAWVAVTAPENWTDNDTRKLKAKFAGMERVSEPMSP